MTDIELLLAVAAAVIFYAVLCNRVTRLMHPIRMRMAELGEKLLNAEQLSADMESHIEGSLNRAYCRFCAWAIVLAIPFVVIGAALDNARNRPDPFDSVPASMRGDLDQFAFFSFVSTLANSPIAAVLFAMEFFVVLVLFLPVGRVFRELFSVRDTIAAALNSGRFPWHHNHA